MTINYEYLNERIYTDDKLREFYLPKAKDIAVSAFKELGHTPKNILSTHRNWMSETLKDQGLNVTLVQELNGFDMELFDTLLALDESFTQAASEAAQKTSIMNFMKHKETGSLMLSSMRDYRNSNCHRRPINDSVMNEVHSEKWVTVEVNNLNAADIQAWDKNYYLIRNDKEFNLIDCGPHRTLYFKQLAKYCADAGSTNFGIMKNTFWKGTFRRGHEHIAWTKF